MKSDLGIPPLLARTELRFAHRNPAGSGSAALLEVELLMLCDGVLKQEKLNVPLYLPDRSIARLAIAAAVFASALVLCMP